jgi:hypothetical protein
VRRFFVVHGDKDQSDALAARLEEEGSSALVPHMGQTVELDY